jgi:rare lipoprotein A
MNFRIWSGLAAATLLMSTVGIAPSSKANPVTASDVEPVVHVPVEAARVLPNSPNSGSVVSATAEETKVGQVASSPPDAHTEAEVPAEPSTLPSVASSPAPAASPTHAAPQSEAMKVGEYQANERAEESVAVMQSYEAGGRQMATLYVRNIPVLSFLGGEASEVPASNPEVKLPGAGSEVLVSQRRQTIEVKPSATPAEDPNSPAVRATALAAQVNQLHRNGVDASSIRAVWDEPKQRYLVKVGEDTLTAIDPATILADTTGDAKQDALQAANRLRRLLGNAEPLTEVEGEPRPSTQVSLGPVQLTVSGYASWYGPGFNGNLSASGEVFNENAMTAAHPSLPFGTQVRVTNMDNGLSVVVRINDRGPYVGDRLIDLSSGAAEVIGLTSSGVAPVKLDVLGAAGN